MPTRYQVLNGYDAQHDPNQLRGSLYEKDPNQYYPYQNPDTQRSYAPPIPKQEAAFNRYTNSVYKPDPRPYYGITSDYRVISNYPTDRVAVPVEIADLTETHATMKNLQTLEHKLNSIDKRESLSSASISGKYMADPYPYYDPTVPEKEKAKSYLKETIDNMKEEL